MTSLRNGIFSQRKNVNTRKKERKKCSKIKKGQERKQKVVVEFENMCLNKKKYTKCALRPKRK